MLTIAKLFTDMIYCYKILGALNVCHKSEPAIPVESFSHMRYINTGKRIIV